MNPAKVTIEDYIQFIIATPIAYSAVEAEKSYSESEAKPSHDAFTRLLQRQPLDTEALWQEAQKHVDKKQGFLCLDDSTLDKPYAKQMELVTRHWSGKHRGVVEGINLISMLWTDDLEKESKLIPCDFRLYDKPIGGKTKNEHFQEMLHTAKERGFRPACVMFDGWYSSLENLKLVHSFGWIFLTRLKCNRKVNPDNTKNIHISEVDISVEHGSIVHLRGFGFIKVFKTLSSNNIDFDYWATNDLETTHNLFDRRAKRAFSIEIYHRAIKQTTGIEKASVRSHQSWFAHASSSLRAFLRLEIHRIRTGMSWYEAKLSIIRDAVRRYVNQPFFVLDSTA